MLKEEIYQYVTALLIKLFDLDGQDIKSESKL